MNHHDQHRNNHHGFPRRRTGQPPDKNTPQDLHLKRLRGVVEEELARLEELTGRPLEIRDLDGSDRVMVCCKPIQRRRRRARPVVGQPAEEFETLLRQCPSDPVHGQRLCTDDLYAILVCALAARRSIELFLESPKFLELAWARVAREI